MLGNERKKQQQTNKQTKQNLTRCLKNAMKACVSLFRAFVNYTAFRAEFLDNFERDLKIERKVNIVF